jgi:hypothetical protein
MMIWKEVIVVWSVYYPDFCLERLRKIMKKLRIADSLLIFEMSASQIKVGSVAFRPCLVIYTAVLESVVMFSQMNYFFYQISLSLAKGSAAIVTVIKSYMWICLYEGL